MTIVGNGKGHDGKRYHERAGVSKKSTLGPQRLWVAAYCNSGFGYLPTAKILAQGGHEAMGVVGRGFFSPRVQDVAAAAGQLAAKAGRTPP